MSEDEQRLTVLAAEDELQWTLRHFDSAGFLAIRGIDEDLAVGDVNAAGGIGHDTFAAAFREHLKIL